MAIGSRRPGRVKTRQTLGIERCGWFTGWAATACAVHSCTATRDEDHRPQGA